MTEIRDRAEPRYNFPRRGAASRQPDANPLPQQEFEPDAFSGRDEQFDTGPVPVYEVDHSGGDTAQGIRDLLSGAALIALGMLYGGSVFTGNPTVVDWIFDGLGTFWVLKGLYNICR